MSIDLYVFEPPGPSTPDEALELIEDDQANPPPGPRLAEFLSAAERRWPGLDDDPDNSPWNSWPLYQSVGGGGTALNLSWSHAETTFPEVIRLALGLGLVVYDPQEDVIVSP